jgi:hypothetical protein
MRAHLYHQPVTLALQNLARELIIGMAQGISGLGISSRIAEALRVVSRLF